MLTLRQRFRAHQAGLPGVRRRRLPTRLRQLSVRVVQAQILLIRLRRRALRHETRLDVHQMPPHLPLVQIVPVVLAVQRKLAGLVRPAHRARRILVEVAVVVDWQGGQLVVGLVERVEGLVVGATATAAQTRHIHGTFVDTCSIAAHLQLPRLAPRRTAQGFGFVLDHRMVLNGRRMGHCWWELFLGRNLWYVFLVLIWPLAFVTSLQ